MAGMTTLPELFWPLMEVESVQHDRCAVCGRLWPLNQHHVVFRSQGELYRDGCKVEKPTVTLCGMGNDLWGTAADGTRVKWCHGKAHHRLLHFRNNGGALEWLETLQPTKYQAALAMEGWSPLGFCYEGFYERLRRFIDEEGLSPQAAMAEMGVDHDG